MFSLEVLLQTLNSASVSGENGKLLTLRLEGVVVKVIYHFCWSQEEVRMRGCTKFKEDNSCP